MGHTKEYQITLKHDLWGQNRTKQIEFWVKKMNELMPILDIKIEDGTERIYNQHHMETSGFRRCGTRFVHVRQRRNVKGGKYEGKTTLDIKANGYDYEVCPLPFWPAEDLYNNTKQKCENDVHPCFSKHSRVSKVVLDGLHHKFETCADLHRIFPYLFKKNKNKPKHRKTKWIHMWEWSTVLYDTAIVFGFDNSYPTEKRAISGGGMPGGEWSMRAYPAVDGQFPQWNETLAKEIDDFYFKMVLAFTKFDHHVGCVHDYFRNGWRN